MTDPQIIIVGAGGHGAVVCDAHLVAGQKVIGFVDAKRYLIGDKVCGLSVIGDDNYLLSLGKRDMLLANGIGGVRDLALRLAIQKRFETSGWKFVGVRHPSAVISPYARVAPCVQVMASAVIQPGAIIHAGCIVNTGAVIEHDTVLEPFVHVACNATICGSVKIGSYSHIGAGSVVRQNVSLGERTVVGAGAVVIYDHNDSGTLMGVPARPIKGRDQ